MKDPIATLPHEFVDRCTKVEAVRREADGFVLTIGLRRWSHLWFCLSKAALIFAWCPAAWRGALRLAWCGVSTFARGLAR